MPPPTPLSIDARRVDVETAVSLSVLCRGSDTRRLRLLWWWLSGGTASDDPSAPRGRADADLLASFARVVQGGALDAGPVADARHVARRAMAVARSRRLQVLTWWEPQYPSWLRQIADPPPVLWFRGRAACLATPAVAIVGSRNATPAGVAVARRLAAGLANAGLAVVSGFARGVDGSAHRAVLQAGGETIAVFGSGVDVVYPREHEDLVAGVEASGGLLSEFLPGTPPLAFRFPLRNRIISGLSRAVVVVEATDRSGSLITARAALEQGRDVLAVPGGVLSGRHRGCHALIKDGARLVETVWDVLDEVGWTGAAARPQAKDQSKTFVVGYLERLMAAGEPYSLDDLVTATGRPASQVLADLGRLELADRVSRTGTGSFVRLDEPAMDSE